MHGYWDILTAFVRSLFNSTFKTNPYMERAVMTGITRISKESIFPDINNLAVITTTTERYATSFGFTQEEVFSTLGQYGMSDKKDDVKRWYDGFAFGNHRDIYNPWSITCFLKEKKLKSYWANTSANSLVGRLIREGTRKALLMDDVVYMNRFMNQMTENVFSFFDTGNRASEKSEPERFYHGFVLGLIADSNIRYTVTSNRESGFGRYDVVMEPKNKPDNAYVFEFKVFDPDTEKTLEDTVKAAHMQMDEKKYDAALLARGIAQEKIRHYGFAFEGKKVLIG